jgi:hypothetical protein
MATNTAASFTNHTGNGTAGPFNISFSYLAEAEVDVTVGGVLKTITTHYTFTSATQITFTSGNEPANGVAIKFQRDTNISAKKVDFADGSVLTEADLDANSDQVLFAQQEIIDKLGGIEEGATGDQTAAEIRTLVESASDSNVFTDADHSKLNAIEASATADQTAAEIRTLVESASDSNVFTDADHTKLNGIEASATADQTAAEIRTLVESASDSNVFTDADHTKLNGIETGATADQTVTEIKSLIAGSPLDASHLAANSVDSSELVDGSIDTSHLSADCVDSTKIADNAIGSEHLQANSVGTSEIADAELTTLAGMQSGTASKLADSTALTADLADLNQLDGMAKQTTITDDDTKFPTSGAVVDFVAAQIAPIGGLEVIATDAAFPNTQPSAGVVISISDAGGVAFNGSGTSTTARTVGGSTVTINNAPSSLNNETLVAGVGLMVSSTGSGQIYNYHKILGKEDDIKQLSDDINDFNARYRVGSSNPTSALDAGDLFFNTSTSKLLVYNATNSAWEEAQSIGNFFISTLSPAFDGSTQDFTITNAPANAQQIVLSINGVVQKPNSGTSTPSEGFALSGSTVKLAAAPASGSDYFAIVLGSTVNIGTPSNNTVTTAILQNGSVTTAKIGADAVDGSKIADDAIANEHIAANAVQTTQINADAVDGTKIADDAIGNEHIASNAVNADSIAANAVGASELADNAVDTAAVADNAITQAKLNFPVANRNLIINGAMQVAQRGTSSTSAGVQTVDRFTTSMAGTDEAATFAQVDVASGTTPYTQGFRKAFKVTNGNQTSGAGAADDLSVSQHIESQNIAQSGWDYTSSSSFITLSFWVKSSVAQTFFCGIRLYGSDQREFCFSYTLSADTWTKVTKSIPGAAGLTILNDNTLGAFIQWPQFWGANYTSSGRVVDTWQVKNNASNYPDYTSTWYTTNDATWELTGVQLEVGSVATDFEHRSFGQELALCQRYCYVWKSSQGYSTMGTGYMTGSTNVDLVFFLPQIMRASPSFSNSGSFRIVGYENNTQNAQGLSSFSMTRSHTLTPYLRGVISGGLTGAVGEFGDNGSNDATAIFSAEL